MTSSLDFISYFETGIHKGIQKVLKMCEIVLLKGHDHLPQTLLL